MIKSADLNLDYNPMNTSMVTESFKISPIQETQSWLEHRDTLVIRRAYQIIFKFTFFYLAAQVMRLLIS